MKYGYIEFILALLCLLFQVMPSSRIHPKKKQFRLNDIENYLNTYIIKNNDKTVIGNKIIFNLTFIQASHFYDRKFKIIKSVTCELFFKTKQEFQFTIKEGYGKNFVMPNYDPFPYDHNEESKTKEILEDNNDYTVNVNQKPFSISVSRTSTKELLFSTKNYPLIFMKDYLELTTTIPSKYMFGFGERSFKFKMETGIYSLYNRDQFGVIENLKGGNNLYGSHPMYLTREESGNYHVVYLRNSLPMDIILDTEALTLKYKILGGIFDFHFFVGDKNPETSIRLYHQFLNGYSIPAFWSMGFHQCRWGYKSLGELKDVMEKYKTNNLPLDTIWSDIDYMNSKQPFTIDEKNFPIDEFKETLRKYQKKWVMIAEPAISTYSESSSLMDFGNKLDTFIKDGDNNVLNSWVWPGTVRFIDYFNPHAEEYWHWLLNGLHNQIPFNGVWLDMNELATFVDGETDSEGNKKDCNDTTSYVFLPGGNKLEKNTICPNAKHGDGKYTHIQVHNFHSVEQARLTYTYLEKAYPDEFPFILSRANAPGFGRWANHWSGDNKGNYEFLKFSITLTFQFNMFGNPNTGSDICGFGGDTKEELCAKWFQMGSLYPFSRAHSHNDYIHKEPYAMGELLLQTTKKSLQFRYSILKYYYSLFLAGGGFGTIFKPLFFVFYEDEKLLDDKLLESQFMIGDDLLVTPLVTEHFWDSMSQYFPKGDWIDLRDYTKVAKNPSVGEFVKVNGRLNEMPPVFLRGGKTIFTQKVDNVSNSYDLDNTFNLLIMLSHEDGKEIYESRGYIPALNNYNSKSKSNSCLGGTCFTNFQTVFDTKTKVLEVIITPPKIIPEDGVKVFISKIRVMNIDTTLYKYKESDIDSKISGSFLSLKEKHSVEAINQYVLDININGTLSVDLANTTNVKVVFQ